MQVANIYDQLPTGAPQEAFEEILRRGGLRLERIVSKGHATPAGEWYDQKEHEWVLLVSGSAGLRIENEPELLILKPGDHLNLPAHCRHRVEWTDPATETIWLALHYRDQE
jgi:cupin 2 domain-containing protein